MKTANLSSHLLDAFFAVVQSQSFSKAARVLHIGQPALSVRIKQLEAELQLTLLERSATGVRPTEAGLKVLQYCQQRAALEGELLDALTSPAAGLAGYLRIAGSSTVMSSVVIPALAPLLKANPKIRIEFLMRQYGELPEILQTGKSDFVLLDRAIERERVKSITLGHERFAVFASSRVESRADLYFDTYEDDRVTENYFRFQKKQGEAATQKFRRDFTGDVHVMLEAVRQGIGRAVLPIHLALNDPDLKRMDQFKTLYEEPVVLNFVAHPFPSRLHASVMAALTEKAPSLLMND